MANSAIQSMQSIDRFLQEVAATEKMAAEAHTEPGSVGGPTQHPVKDVDDSTEEASEGFRSAENDADVKEDQGPPSVDNTPENVAAKKAMDGKSEDGSVNPPGTAAEDQLQIGTKKEPTGQDPSVETSSVKAEKEDPSSAPDGSVGHSSHPARTNNSELDGYKYAEMELDQLAKVASDLGNSLLAGLSKEASDCDSGGKSKCSCGKPGCPSCNEKEAELKGDQDKLDVDNDGKIEGSDLKALRAGDDAGEDQEDDSKSASDLAGQAGWELAGLLSGDFDKKAADSVVKEALVEIIKVASDDADKVAEFLSAYQEEMSKKAMGEMPAGVDPSALMGGEAGADPAMADAEVEMADAMAGGEAPEGGDDVEQLAAVLESLGISPEELEAAMAAEAGGDMPAGPEMAEEEVMEEPADEAPGMEVEASDKEDEASEKEAAAKKGAAEKTTRDYIQEVLERSRRR